MLYLKSWSFRAGLALTIAGAIALYFVHPVLAVWGSSGSGTGDLGYSVEYTDYHIELVPVLLVVGGLIVMALAAAKSRVTPSSSN